MPGMLPQALAWAGHGLGARSVQGTDWDYVMLSIMSERRERDNQTWNGSKFYILVPLVENRGFSLYLEIPRGNIILFGFYHQNFP